MITTEQKIMHAYNEGKAAGMAERVASTQVTDEQIVERAVQAMYDRCYPNNTEDDWTEWARTRAECCDQAAVAMRALLSAPPAAAETEEVPMLWWFNDDNGLPYASTPYELEALQWRNSGKIVHCTKASIQEAKPVAAEFLKLRFFRDLSDAQRMAVFEVFGLLPAGFDEALTHGIQYRLFSKMLAAAPQQPAPLKDHQIAQTVNAVRDVAIKFHDHQSLRERIAEIIVPALQQPAPADNDAIRDAALEEAAKQCLDIYSWRGAYASGCMSTNTTKACASAIRNLKSQPAPAVGSNAVRNAALEEAAILFDEMHAVTGTQHNYFAFGAGRIRALQAREQS